MLIIRMLNCIGAAFCIVTLSNWPSGSPDGHLLRVTIPDAINTIQHSDDEHIMLETCKGL